MVMLFCHIDIKRASKVSNNQKEQCLVNTAGEVGYKSFQSIFNRFRGMWPNVTIKIPFGILL